ncbi:hypothetical protein [Alistipes senegalensis]|uniref:hypothetical protein n=1 Tax=Alistipes senegalensis TaxID=1288121 RepID=UPI0018AC8B55|nr:hypothetical protein [Alistipes senegalensis]
MKILRILLLAAAVASVDRAVSQPVHTFRVKIGIDRESVDSLGGRDRVIRHIEEMFRRVNRAFNYDARFRAIYDFVVDWNAFYIYEGVSADEVMKPHPDHDYLVVMDGYKSDPREVGGGWYGDTIQTVYHARTHNDRFNSPFEPMAVDGIIHEFGHARGVPDIYAMKVDADKNPVNGETFVGVRCIMNYPYGETHWCDYAVNMIDRAAGWNIDIDDLVAGILPEHIRVEVADDRSAPVKDAAVRFYPVRWYTYSVNPEPCAVSETDRKGRCTLPVSQVFQPEQEFGLRYCNCLVEVESEGVKTYGWLPLYELQNTRFDGKKCHILQLTLKRSRALVRKFDPDR